MKLSKLTLFALFLGLFSACSTSSDDNGSTVQLSLQNLEPLQNGFHYEGWVVLENGPLTTGKFNVNANGDITDLDGDLIPNGRFGISQDVSSATDFILTIEPSGDIDDVPAETHHLAGSFDGSQADLSTAHSASLGSDFSSASGSYILATPTDGMNTNENSGIWFLDISSGSPEVSLDLPDLPDGWKYEGWAVSGGTPISSGTFVSVSAADDDDPYSGSQMAPPFPGEDFLVNAPSGLSFPLDLSGGMAVISIEPDPDDSPAPFALKPLAGPIPDAAADHTSYTMNNNAASFSSGTVIIQ